jgi:Fic family protein
MEIFIEVDKKRDQLLSLKPTEEARRKLERKFRLESSFHSNHMEGNTLSYGETQMLLFFGKATGDHEKREYDEMEAHDVAVKMVEDWAKDLNRGLTESDVRQLNKIILVRPYWKEAITPDDQPTRKEIFPGDYKSSPNSVRLKNGEIHAYASPEETPILMAELFERLNDSLKSTQHPIITAAWSHHKFVSIHPFDDGNGRVARLLTNYILLRNNYPPIIIKTENKEEYLTVLQKADVGDLEPFIHFLIKELHWSLDLYTRAAEGRSIEELNDVDKELALLKQQLEKEESLRFIKSNEVILSLWQNSFYNLFDALHNKLTQFDELFYNKSEACYINGGLGTRDGDNYNSDINRKFDDIIQIVKKLQPITDRDARRILEQELNSNKIDSISYQVTWTVFKKSIKKQFDNEAQVKVSFNTTNYVVSGNGLSREAFKEIQKLYHEVLSNDEINDIVNAVTKTTLANIKLNLNTLPK